jgi:hypothetical protein
MKRLAVLLLVAGACSSSNAGGPGAADSGGDAEPDDARTHEAAPGTAAGADAAADATPVDAPVDAGSASDDGAAEAAPRPTCGSPPARYTLLTGANAGLVRDNATGLVWMAQSVGSGEPPQTQPDAAMYCAGRGLRLPTKDEALALAAAYAPCAFGQWSTWTSTASSPGDAWVIDYAGDASPQLADNFPSAVLCVKSATDAQ